MKKTMISFLLLSSIYVLISCNKTIDGNAIEVKSLAVSLVESEMKNQAIPVFIMQLYNEHPRLWGNPSYNDCKNAIKDERAQKIVSVIDERVKSLNLRLKGVRTVDINKDLNKVVCEAIIESDESELFNITYSAQLTDDKKNIYVEILKMNPISK